MPELITACPRNCFSTCSMRVEVEEGRSEGGEWESLAVVDEAVWRRTTTVRLYSLESVTPGTTGGPDGLGMPLPADVGPELVHFRGLEVEIDGETPGSLERGVSSRVTVRSLRAF